MADQFANVSGSNNVVIQILGDGNTVVISGSVQLKLHRPTITANASRFSELELLRPTPGLITLVGRRQELSDLRRWLQSGEALSARVLVGPAGVGKTRLAHHLCDEAASLGWNAGFVSHRDLEIIAGVERIGAWKWDRPTLVVVDYAATVTTFLRRLLADLANHDSAIPLRLLLLERHANPDTGWWEGTFGTGGWRARDIQGLLSPAEPVPSVDR
jgi:hypothetical protein